MEATRTKNTLIVKTKIALTTVLMTLSLSTPLYMALRGLAEIAGSLVTNSAVNVVLWALAFLLGAIISKRLITKVGAAPWLAITFPLILFSISVPFLSEWFEVNRDPGFLAWGTRHFFNNALVPFDGPNSPGFYGTPDGTFVQGFPGYYMLSSNQGFLFQLVPDSGVNLTPLITGCLALFIFMWFLWRLTVNIWVTLVISFSISTSIIWTYVTSNPFTEPVAALIFLSSLILARQFVEDSNPNWALALVVFSYASSLTRIDGLITASVPIIAVLVFATIRKPQNKNLFAGSGLLIFVGSWVGLMQGGQFSPVYFEDQGSQVQLLALVTLLVGSAIALVLFFPQGSFSRVAHFLDKHMRNVLMSLLIISFLLMPFSWYLRTPSEDSRFQSAWPPLIVLLIYFGPLVLLGFGVLMFRYKTLLSEFRVQVVIVIFLVAAFTYLQNPFIFPDEPWAGRRQMVSTWVGLGLLSGFGLSELIRIFKGSTK